MGSNKNDKWLGRLKDSVGNHSEPLPDNFWEELQKDISLPAPVVKRKIPESLILIMAAAVVLLCLVLYLPERNCAIVLETADAEAVEVELTVPDTAGLPVNCAVEVIMVGSSVNAQKMPPGVEKDTLQGRELANLSGYVPARGEENSGQVIVRVKNDDSGEKTSDVGKEKIGEIGRNREQERAELLEKQEYSGYRGGYGKPGGKMMLAFVAGSVGAVDAVQNNRFMMAGTGPDITNPAGAGSCDNVLHYVPTVPGSFASFINMGGQQIDNVSWLGGTSPAVFNNSTICYNCPYDHKEPVKLGISFAVELMRGFYVESGVSYQYLNSSMSAGGGAGITQKLHYIGIPFRLGVAFCREKRCRYICREDIWWKNVFMVFWNTRAGVIWSSICRVCLIR